MAKSGASLVKNNSNSVINENKNVKNMTMMSYNNVRQQKKESIVSEKTVPPVQIQKSAIAQKQPAVVVDAESEKASQSTNALTENT